jgi:hypothetical protein
MWAESIWKHFVQQLHSAALGIPDCLCPSLTLYQIQCLPRNLPHCHLNYPVAIPIKLILSVGDAFRCSLPISFDWMMDYSSDSADTEYLMSFSREVLCRQTL